MQDFAYLFPDSAAAWLRGRGDGRFQRYERHYRIDRASAPSPMEFDLEKSNTHFSSRYGSRKERLVALLYSKPIAALATFLVFLWSGSLLISTVGTTHPAAVGAVLCIVFVGMRVNSLKRRSRRS